MKKKLALLAVLAMAAPTPALAQSHRGIAHHIAIVVKAYNVKWYQVPADAVQVVCSYGSPTTKCTTYMCAQWVLDSTQLYRARFYQDVVTATLAIGSSYTDNPSGGVTILNYC